ncbi:MAG: cell division protein FtsQ/DivIB [Lachnospiraceae bacterium]|nr:cell division protein FtsQ/DivIB [Lachnospiraceae bacterium]
MKYGSHRGRFLLISLLLILLVLGGGSYYVLTEYRVNELQVVGNIHYTNEEIAKMVLPGGLKNNSLYLKLWYRNREMKDIPFVETMDVEIMSHHKIKVTVYEKALAGCFEYLGRYMYFDKDGVVVEGSDQTTEGVPVIKGLNFDHVVLYESLPVENEDIFSEILKVTQLLDKYELHADQIFFSGSGEVTLYFGGVRVNMGGEANVDEKVMQLGEILPNLTGQNGILHMENFTPETTKVTFVPDK